MAKVFLDTNVVIDFVERRKKDTRSALKSYLLYASVLSIHILIYATKNRLPYAEGSNINRYFTLVDFDKSVMLAALNGPTKDFEDNVQLHSAIEADCNIFLTSDKDLLKMKFFGNMRIQPTILAIKA